MSIKLGSHVFAPRPFTTALAVLMIIGLASLGRWQLNRAAEKRALYDAFGKGADVTRTIDVAASLLPRYQHVAASGSFDQSRQILIDNMTDGHGRAGYFVITPFALTDGGWILVNRGWVSLGASRAQLPSIDVSSERREIQGRADHLPTPGIQMGARRALAPPFPIVANFPGRQEIARLLGGSTLSPAAEVVLLDPNQRDGYVREWRAPGIPPIRHVAYAVQWFGLAVALAVIYVVTNLRREPSIELQP